MECIDFVIPLFLKGKRWTIFVLYVIGNQTGHCHIVDKNNELEKRTMC